MPLWLQVVFAIVMGIQIPFGIWVVRKFMAMECDIARLQQDAAARQQECANRLTWLRSMDEKLDTANEGIAEIKGFLRRA